MTPQSATFPGMSERKPLTWGKVAAEAFGCFFVLWLCFIVGVIPAAIYESWGTSHLAAQILGTLTVLLVGLGVLALRHWREQVADALADLFPGGTR